MPSCVRLCCLLVVALVLASSAGRAQTSLTDGDRHSVRRAAGAMDAADATVVARWRARLAEGAALRMLVQLATAPARNLEAARPAGGAARAEIAAARARVVDRLGAGARTARGFTHLPAVVLEVDAAGLEALLADPDVVAMEEDRGLPRALAQSVPLIQADQVWARGYRGTGIAVAILDDGVDRSHPAFGGRVVAEACYSGGTDPARSLCPGGGLVSSGVGAATPCPTCTHGTHVAGIAAGQNGVAPEASIIAVQVFSSNALAYYSDIEAAIDHVLTLAATHTIAAVNLSLGGGGYSTTCDALSPTMRDAFAALRVAGIAPVVASGNDGYATQISFPACLSNAVSVGATSKSDVVESYSNATSFLSLLAPGGSITAPVPGTGTGVKSGTSMATPHVAGAWALLRQVVPTASVDQVLTALRSTGTSILDGRTGTTFPRVQVNAAASALAPFVLSPLSFTVPATGGAVTATLTSAAAGAAWTATSSAAWLGVSPASGTGGATLTLTAAAHTTSVTSRSATVSVGGLTATVTQAGATPTFTVTPSTWVTTAAGGTQSVSVVSSIADASWGASSSAPWLTTGSGGIGTGSVLLTAAAHTTSALTRQATATIAGHAVTVVQAGATPTFTLSPTQWTASANGASRTVALTSSLADAPWTASSGAAWLVVSPTSGTGAATLTVTAAAHTASVSSRSTAVTIAGQSFVVTQDGATSTFTVSPTTWTAAPADAIRSVALTSSVADAPWTATSGAAWLAVSPSSGTGSATITLTAAAHTSSASPRSTTVTIAGQTLAVTQSGVTPTFTVSPTTCVVIATGGACAVTVTPAPVDATWSASSTAPWVTLGSAGGIGAGVVSVAASPYTSSAVARTATVTVAGQTVTVIQAGATPTFALSASALSLPQGGGGQAVLLTASLPDASWTTSTSAPWVAVQPAAGSGSGEIGVRVTAHGTSVQPRTATVTIAGLTLTITQPGASPVFAVAPTQVLVPTAGGTYDVQVSATPVDASWTATSDVPWAIVSNADGVGSGVVRLTVSPTTVDAPRTGTVRIAGSSVVLVQGGGTPTATLDRTSWQAPPEGGALDVGVSASASTGAWVASSDVPWLTVSPSRGTGSTGRLVVSALPASSEGAGLRPGILSLSSTGSARLVVTQVTPAGPRTGAITVRPRAADTRYVRYLAEGAVSDFFDTRIALFNPALEATRATLTFLRTGDTPVTHEVDVPAGTRVTVWPRTVPGLARAEFSTTVSASVPLVVDRTMTWDGTGYGAHAETAAPEPSPVWYFAEGATHGGFDLFYLLQNPADHEVAVRVRYLRASGGPLVKRYVLAPQSRTNVWVNLETFDGGGRALASAEVSAVVESEDGTAIVAERAMYLSRADQRFAAGHESLGVPAPTTRWFLAEGRTGPFFDTFVLVANPSDSDAQVRLTYLRSDGATFSRTFIAPANARRSVWVDREELPGVPDMPLADAEVSTTVESTNGVPIIVERAMWWPGDVETWHEAHDTAGAIETGTAWALAEGEAGGVDEAQTYVLMANTSAYAGQARVTLHFEDGTTAVRTYDLLPQSRRHAAIADDFGDAVADRRFAVTVESVEVAPGAPLAQLVVERAMYTTSRGVPFAAGTCALATRLR